MDPEWLQLRLVDTGTGRVALAYCALPEDQWIVYTPNGDWDGSARVGDWVRFYVGLRPVSASEAERWHRRARIEAALEEAFPRRTR